MMLLLLCLFGYSSAVIYQLNETDHEKMPNLVRLDPYEKCLRDPTALYCTVGIDLVSDTPSPLLNMIQEYSEDKSKHFNYTHIYQGICVNQRCQGINSSVPLPSYLESCLNRTFWEEYRLKTRTTKDIFCNNKNNAFDTEDIIVAAVFLALIMFNAFGTLYDVFFTTGKANEGVKLLLCFSIRRNYLRLIKDNYEGDSRDGQLRSLNGMRSICIGMVILAHSLAVCIFVENPIYLEKMFYSPFTMLITNGTLIMQGFFTLSGLLLVFKYFPYMEKNEYSWTIILKGILLRWLRLTPAYAVIIGFTATCMRHLGSGPLWDMFVNVEVMDCRRDWWRHFIYINNYFEDSYCMIQSWYLAADMQLFLVGIIIVVFCRTKTSRIVTLSTLSVIGIIVPTLHTYYQDLDGVMLLTPETARNYFITDDTFNHVYKRGHTNLLGYILGMALGYILYYWNDSGINLNKYKKLRPLYWCTAPVLIALMYSGSIFYGDRPRTSLLFRTVYSALVKPVFCLTTAVFMLGMLLKFDNVYRSILEWKGWTVPSRLCYNVYLLHFLFVRFYVGIQTSIMKATFWFQVIFFIGLLTFSFVFAFVFWMLLEAPMAELMKTLMSPKKREEETSEANTVKIDK